MTALGEITLEEAAKQAAGNWQDFTCFWWCRKKEIEDPENWAIIYTHNRDSGLLDQSNAEVIAEALKPFSDTENPDVVFESHSHWLVGHIDGFSVRVFKDGEITSAFRRYHELATSMADYPVLDDTDYSDREYEATLETSLLQRGDWRSNISFPKIGSVRSTTGFGTTTRAPLKTLTTRVALRLRSSLSMHSRHWALL